MSDTYNVNGTEVSTYDKDVLADYRSKWTRDEDVTGVDEENHVAPQYAKHFPGLEEYPQEVYSECLCLSVEEAREQLRRGVEVLFWNGPPCNPNAYLQTGKVRRMPPVPYTPTIGEPEEPSDAHFEVTHGSFDNRSDSIFGDMISKVRLDCVVSVNPEVA